jgi:hypothetical protein
MKKIMFATIILFCTWVLASFADVVTHNLGDCVYQSWNFFTIMLEVF